MDSLICARLGVFPRGSTIDSQSEDASRWCLGVSVLSSRNRTLQSPTPISMPVPIEVETSTSGSEWVSDLVLCVMRRCESRCVGPRSGLRVWSSQANVHDAAFHNLLLIVLRGQNVACVLHELLQSIQVTARQRSRFLPPLPWSRASPGCDCTCASSSACAPTLSRSVQASVLHSKRIRHVHTILGLHPSVCS